MKTGNSVIENGSIENKNTKRNDIENGNKTILKASAGTGKTYRVSLEYVYNLIKNVSYKNIVVMTFTKKATAEIKERVFDFLYQIAFEEGNGESLEKSLKSLYNLEDRDINKKKLQECYFEMIKNKEDIRIYTIDGFTNKIFKQAIAPYFGIYSFETLDEEEDSFYEELLKKILNNEEYFKKFEFIIEEKGEKRDLTNYVTFLKEILNLEKNYLLAKDFDFSERDSKTVNTNFVKNIENIFEIVERFAEKKDKNPVEFLNKNVQDTYLKFKEIIVEKDVIENKREKIEIILQNWDKFFEKKPGTEEILNYWNGTKISSRSKDNQEVIQNMQDEKEAFIKSLSNYIFIQKVVPLHEKLKELVLEIYELVQKMKISSKRFTHDDITTYTYKFIFDEKLKFIQDGKVTSDFLEIIGGEIETVMIDEFQDTSVLQWKILSILITSAKNIICVGDEKQSIYNWRGGEKELFEKLETIIDGKVENLDKSYRSYREIIENVNKIYTDYRNDWAYEPVLYRDDEEYQYGYFEYDFKQLPSKSSRNNSTEDFDDEDSYEKEKNYMKIIEMIKSGKVKNLGKSCIICRTNGHLNEIVYQLNRENIPYTLNSNASLLEHEVIQPIYRLMKYFLYNNIMYLLEFIRSDLIGGLNDHVKYILENKEKIEQYIRGKIEKTELPDYSDIELIERNSRLFSEVLENIRTLNKLSKRLNDKFLKENFSREIIEKFDVIKYYSTNSDIKNIFNFFNLLKEYNNLFDFINFIEEKKDKIKQVSSADIDAINLLTIHKSKGLEYDTVFYYKRDSYNKGSNKNNLKTFINFDRKYENVTEFLVIFEKYNKIFIEGSPYFELNKISELKDEIEEINADYVALTRAKKNLILLFDIILKKDGSYQSELVSKIIKKYENERNYFVGKVTESEKNGDLRAKEEKENREDIENKEVIKTDKSDLENIMLYFSDNVFDSRLKGYQTDLEGEFKRKKGLAMHYYFEHMKNDIDTDKKAAKRAILNRYGNMLGKRILVELVERMEKFISQNERLYDSKFIVYNEFEIYDNEGSKKVIDRINIDETKKEIYIYDYKTGYEPQENEEYKAQIENYKKILTEKTNGEYKIFTEILEV